MAETLVDRGVRSCANPLCDYLLVGGGALYCCGSCAMAHDQKYEIHEDGRLGHSPMCAHRTNEGEGDG